MTDTNATPKPPSLSLWGNTKGDALPQPAALVRFALDVPRGLLAGAHLEVLLPDATRENLDELVQVFEAALAAGLVAVAGDVLTHLGPDLARSVVDRLRARGQELDVASYPDRHAPSGERLYLVGEAEDLPLFAKPAPTSGPTLDPNAAKLRDLAGRGPARGVGDLEERLALLGPGQTLGLGSLLRYMGWAEEVNVDTDKRARTLASGWARTAVKRGTLIRIGRGVYQTPRKAAGE